MGMLAGIHATRIAQGLPVIPPPRSTALGSLVHYISNAEAKNFQPANITFDLLPQLDEATRRKVRDKKLRHKMVCEKALDALACWLRQIGITPARREPEDHHASSLVHLRARPPICPAHFRP